MPSETTTPTATWRMALTDAVSADDVVRMEFLADARDEGEVWTISIDVDGVLPVDGWVGTDLSVRRSVLARIGTGDDRRLRGSTYARGALGGVLIHDRGMQGTSLVVSAGSQEAALRLADLLAERAPAPPPQPDDQVDFQLWHRGNHGGVRSRRRLDIAPWPAIRRNYPPRVQAELGRLMEMGAPAGGGKLVLWHGPPGTGKTTALRSLAHAWRGWCDVHYVSDAERLFGDLDYLHEVVGGYDLDDCGGHGDAGAARWRLVVAEDSDEYLRADARQAAGASLGRLLNVTDGILGQGLRTLVLLTTNEPLSALHPAIVRPGRCLAEMEFPAFTAVEARAWWGGPVPGAPGEVSLAELFERRGEVDRYSNVPDTPELIGTYL